jgi:hypothetical protein
VPNDVWSSLSADRYFNQQFHRQPLHGQRLDKAKGHTPPRSLPSIRWHYQRRLLVYERAFERSTDLNDLQQRNNCFCLWKYVVYSIVNHCRRASKHALSLQNQRASIVGAVFDHYWPKCGRYSISASKGQLELRIRIATDATIQ